jgi:hypothetical protein
MPPARGRGGPVQGSSGCGRRCQIRAAARVRSRIEAVGRAARPIGGSAGPANPLELVTGWEVPLRRRIRHDRTPATGSDRRLQRGLGPTRHRRHPRAPHRGLGLREPYERRQGGGTRRHPRAPLRRLRDLSRHPLRPAPHLRPGRPRGPGVDRDGHPLQAPRADGPAAARSARMRRSEAASVRSRGSRRSARSTG